MVLIKTRGVVRIQTQCFPDAASKLLAPALVVRTELSHIFSSLHPYDGKLTPSLSAAEAFMDVQQIVARKIGSAE